MDEDDEWFVVETTWCKKGILCQEGFAGNHAFEHRNRHSGKKRCNQNGALAAHRDEFHDGRTKVCKFVPTSEHLRRCKTMWNPGFVCLITGHNPDAMPHTDNTHAALHQWHSKNDPVQAFTSSMCRKHYRRDHPLCNP